MGLRGTQLTGSIIYTLVTRRTLPKNLIRPIPYRIAKASGSGDLLSHSPVHADARDEVDYGGGTSSESWQNPRSIPG
jgi:hypothetical protein